MMRCTRDGVRYLKILKLLKERPQQLEVFWVALLKEVTLRFYAFMFTGLAILIVLYILYVQSSAARPDLVTIPAGVFQYRPAGDFRRDKRVTDAPYQERRIATGIEIMKYPVSVKDYAACVNDGSCNQVASEGSNNMPQTGVSYLDAVIYAEWLSEITGQTWRLPKDEEWVRAAGERFHDDAISISSDDPSDRWVAEYKANMANRDGTLAELRVLGGYGHNSLGIADLSGAVWEWTQTCMKNGTLTANGFTLHVSSEYCGVRLAEGRHRAFVIDFVRDAKVGGCAVGLPPDYLGFRLVRQKIF